MALHLIRGKPIAAIGRDLQRELQKLPTRMGAEAIQFVNQNFRKQGFEDNGLQKWQDRKKTNEKGRRRGLLIGNGTGGQLRKSIRVLRKTGGDGGFSVTIGTDKTYAKVHNEGGEINQTVTDKQRGFFWAMYYQTKKAGDKSRKHKERLSDEAEVWKSMALAKTLHIKIPKRQFMGQSQTLQKAFKNLLHQAVAQAFKP
jgi:phage gpG-like protein